MRIIADENMPQVQTLFAPYGEVVTLPGRDITAAHLADADVLLVRSVTRVDGKLLGDSPVGFVGSATIGTDHLDLAYLAARGTRVASAPGCNANAVVEYVVASLFALDPAWMDKQVGILGCGNVGGRLHNRLRRLGVNCRCYDPFLKPGSNPDLTGFEETLASEIICLHTPLTHGGPFPTFHLLDEAVLASLTGDRILLNAGRGPVVDNGALLKILEGGSPLRVVLDVWEPEPAIDCRLLEQVQIGTPHIAGYSYEGKINGTRQVLEAFCQWRGEPSPKWPAPTAQGEITYQGGGLAELVLKAYDPRRDHLALATALEIPDSPLSEQQRGERFDNLRKLYRQRREFSFYRVRGRLQPEVREQARILGFWV